jgi:hypothetical protein
MRNAHITIVCQLRRLLSLQYTCSLNCNGFRVCVGIEGQLRHNNGTLWRKIPFTKLTIFADLIKVTTGLFVEPSVQCCVSTSRSLGPIYRPSSSHFTTSCPFLQDVSTLSSHLCYLLQISLDLSAKILCDLPNFLYMSYVPSTSFCLI